SYPDMVGRAEGKDRPAERLPVVKGPLQAGSAVSKPSLLIDCCGILRRPAIVSPFVKFMYHGVVFEFEWRGRGYGARRRPRRFCHLLGAKRGRGQLALAPPTSLLAVPVVHAETAAPQPVQDVRAEKEILSASLNWHKGLLPYGPP